MTRELIDEILLSIGLESIDFDDDSPGEGEGKKKDNSSVWEK